MKAYPKNIVLAEDNQDDAVIFESALLETCADYNLYKAANGKDLIDMLSVMEPPDVVIIDLTMPKMSGIECLKWIRENERLTHVPVLILSASTSPDDKFDSIKYGADRYIVKPNDYAAMKNITAAICDGSWAT